MIVEELKLTNFRNYEKAIIKFDDNINFITGQNGVGKTNILEAISLLSLGKSFVTTNEMDCIRIGAEYAIVEAVIKKEYSLNVKIIISRQGKRILINEKEIKRLSDLSGQVMTVSFSPKNVRFFKDSPIDRRKFLDRSLSMLNKTYLSSLSKFKELLKNRNNLIKQDNDYLLISVVDEQMAVLAHEIIKQRLRFLDEIQTAARVLYKAFDEDATIDIKYEPSTEFVKDVSKFKKKYLDQMRNQYEIDIRKRATSRGIHLEDYVLRLNGSNIAVTGSQGQNRIVSLILRLSLMKLIKDDWQILPILLLDDALSELDEEHQNKLMKLLKSFGQTFITGTEKIETMPQHAEYIVSDHEIRRK